MGIPTWIVVLLLHTSVIFLSLASADCETTTAESPLPRPIVLLIEDSKNMHSAYTSLQQGAASLFTKYQGRAQSLSFYLYRFDSTGVLQAELTDARSGDDFVGTLQGLIERPMPGAASCKSMCCCTSAIYKSLDRLIAAHNASTFFVAADCIRTVNEMGSQLAKDLRSAGSELYMFVPVDSYCAGEGISARATLITDFAFNINMASVGDFFSSLLVYHRPLNQGYYIHNICPNDTIRFRILDGMQMASLIFHRGRLNRPFVINTPNGTPVTNLEIIAQDPNGGLVVTIYGGCPDSWTFRKGFCVKTHPSAATWNKAEAECRKYNATLLSPVQGGDGGLLGPVLGNAEQDLLLGETEVWLSLTDVDTSRRLEWKLYKDALSLNHLNTSTWAAGEPKAQLAGKRCSFLNRLTGRWSTATCLGLKRFTCVRPAVIFQDEGEKKFLEEGWWSLSVDSFSGCGFSVVTML